MGMEARELRRIGFEEYLALERASDERWEYVNGEAWAVGSARPEHNVVAGNAFAVLRAALRGKKCLAFHEAQKIATPATGAYHYPDVSVICGPPAFDARDEHAITNPVVIVGSRRRRPTTIAGASSRTTAPCPPSGTTSSCTSASASWSTTTGSSRASG